MMPRKGTEIVPESAVPPQSIDVGDLRDLAGKPLGVSSWKEVTQDEVNRFAEATGDTQWIHVDPEAARKGPFGQTVGHVFLALGMFTGMLYELLAVTGADLILLYVTHWGRFSVHYPIW